MIKNNLKFFLQKIQSRALGTKKLTTYLVSFFIFIIIDLFVYFIAYQDFVFKDLPLEKEKEEIVLDLECPRRLLDGVCVQENKRVNSQPIAVMIDNSADAGLAAGIDKASLVYEAPVEGGTTRFLAIFNSNQDIEEIGPIRSARPYFLDWALELDVLYVHCGGSPEALVKIQKERVFDFNEFYNGSYFWRSKRRLAPHNIFTSMANLNEFISEQDRKVKEDVQIWQYRDEGLASSTASSSLDLASTTLEIRIPKFFVTWKYDKMNKNYLRYIGDHIDKTERGDEIRAKNIIVQYVHTEVIDAKLRLRMTTIGSGEAWMCAEGFCASGFWQKGDIRDRTRFFLENKEEFKFVPGVTWVEVVSNGDLVNLQ